MGTRVKICQSPFSPNLEVFEDLVIKLHAPYSDGSVTIKVNPNVQHYQENQDLKDTQVRQVMATTDTDETVTLKLDLGENTSQTFTVAENEYEIRLVEIGKEIQHGQSFPYFEFDVTKN